ncbi:MAG: myxococcus cysteine-rich repeat containing protein [archaeon]|nr:myxococcus cysteine-rich repeat containing protein [archaeon]
MKIKNNKMLFSVNFLFFIFIILSTPVFAGNICQYAASATATSSSSSSEPVYATGVPDANGDCSIWSGIAKSWNPENWNIKATLTLNYATPVYATDFTIYGDYDICWSKMWLKNSGTGQQLLVFEGFDNSCASEHSLDGSFLADAIILETCGWGWSSTDAVKLCGNAETSNPVCGNSIQEVGEECDDGNNINGDGCSSICKIEHSSSVEVYFAPYVGDIDGNINSDWYYFYDQLRQWHDYNSIPVGLSIYPDTMNDYQFNRIVGDMYASENIEIITKGESEYNGIPIDRMSYSEVKSNIRWVQNKFIAEMENQGYYNVKAPVTYNQNQAKFTETIRDAVYDLGFRMYFEQYSSEYGYMESLPDFDITQYCVSLTYSGYAGPDQTFKQPEEVIDEILNYYHPQMIYINGIKVIPMLSHQQDFALSKTSAIIDQEKWNIYTTMLLMAQDDPRIQLLKPVDIYNMRHGSYQPVCGNNIQEDEEECDDGNNIDGDGCSSNCRIEEPSDTTCQYAASATATSSSSSSEPIYATGAPDANGDCSIWSGTAKSWNPANWNIKATLTLNYAAPVYATDFTIYGDYDICWSKMWLKNGGTGQQLLVFEGFDNSCVSAHSLDGTFLADTIMLETCGWGWSSTDAVKLCGTAP